MVTYGAVWLHSHWESVCVWMFKYVHYFQTRFNIQGTFLNSTVFKDYWLKKERKKTPLGYSDALAMELTLINWKQWNGNTSQQGWLATLAINYIS